jgi:hypothetical protein
MATADFTPSATFPASSTLLANLHKLAARRNALRAWQAMAGALSWGIGLAALMILAYRFYLVDGPAWLPALPILISILLGWRSGVRKRGSTFDAALEADKKLGWKEQLSSAFAFAQPNAHITPTVLVPSLVEDAASRSQALEPKSLYPLQFNRTHRVLALASALLLVAAFMPNVPWLLSAAEQTQRSNIAQQGKGLVAVAKEVKKDEPKQADEEAESRRLARRMEALGRKMMRGRMNKKEALTSLGELKKDLEKSTKTMGRIRTRAVICRTCSKCCNSSPISRWKARAENSYKRR